MKVRFIGTADPTENEVCEVFGITFPKGDAVTVPADIGERLSKNPTFEVISTRGKPHGEPAA